MANVTTKNETNMDQQLKAQLADAQRKLDLVKTYGKAFVKSRKGEIKVGVSDVAQLNDLLEVFFGARMNNISDRIHKTYNDKPKNWNSELIVREPDGSIFKIYSNVSEYKIDELLNA